MALPKSLKYLPAGDPARAQAERDRFIFENGRLVGYRDPQTGEVIRRRPPDPNVKSKPTVLPNMPESAPTANGRSLQEIPEGSLSDLVREWEAGGEHSPRPYLDLVDDNNYYIPSQYGAEEQSAVADIKRFRDLQYYQEQRPGYIPEANPKTSPHDPRGEAPLYERTGDFFDDLYSPLGDAYDKFDEGVLSNVPYHPLTLATRMVKGLVSEPAAVEFRDIDGHHTFDDILWNAEAVANMLDATVPQTGPITIPAKTGLRMVREGLGRAATETAEGITDAAKYELWRPAWERNVPKLAGASDVDPALVKQLEDAEREFARLHRMVKREGNRDAVVLQKYDAAGERVKTLWEAIGSPRAQTPPAPRPGQTGGQVQSNLGDLDPRMTPDRLPQEAPRSEPPRSASTQEPDVSPPPRETPPADTDLPGFGAVQRVDLDELEVNPTLFQHRDADPGSYFNQANVDKMLAEGYNEALMEPIWVWRNPDTARLTVLSGHHRHAFISQLRGMDPTDTRFQSVAIREFTGDLREARRWAARSNYMVADPQLIGRVNAADEFRSQLIEDTPNATHKDILDTVAAEMGISRTAARQYLHLSDAGPDVVRAIMRLDEQGINAQSVGVGIGRFRAQTPDAMNDRAAVEVFEGILEKQDSVPPQDAVYETLTTAWKLERREKGEQAGMFGGLDLTQGGNPMMDRLNELLNLKKAWLKDKAKLKQAIKTLDELPKRLGKEPTAKEKQVFEGTKNKLKLQVRQLEKALQGEEKAYVKALRNPDAVVETPPAPREEVIPDAEPIRAVDEPPGRTAEPIPAEPRREEPGTGPSAVAETPPVEKDVSIPPAQVAGDTQLADELADLRAREQEAMAAVKEVETPGTPPKFVEAAKNYLRTTQEQIADLEARMGGRATGAVDETQQTVTPGGETTLAEAREDVDRLIQVIAQPARADDIADSAVNMILPQYRPPNWRVQMSHMAEMRRQQRESRRVTETRQNLGDEVLSALGFKKTLIDELQTGRRPTNPTTNRLTADDMDALEEALEESRKRPDRLREGPGQTPAGRTREKFTQDTDVDIQRTLEEDIAWAARNDEVYREQLEIAAETWRIAAYARINDMLPQAKPPYWGTQEWAEDFFARVHGPEGEEILEAMGRENALEDLAVVLNDIPIANTQQGSAIAQMALLAKAEGHLVTAGNIDTFLEQMLDRAVARGIPDVAQRAGLAERMKEQLAQRISQAWAGIPNATQIFNSFRGPDLPNRLVLTNKQLAPRPRDFTEQAKLFEEMNWHKRLAQLPFVKQVITPLLSKRLLPNQKTWLLNGLVTLRMRLDAANDLAYTRVAVLDRFGSFEDVVGKWDMKTGRFTDKADPLLRGKLINEFFERPQWAQDYISKNPKAQYYVDMNRQHGDSQIELLAERGIDIKKLPDDEYGTTHIYYGQVDIDGRIMKLQTEPPVIPSAADVPYYKRRRKLDPRQADELGFLPIGPDEAMELRWRQTYRILAYNDMYEYMVKKLAEQKRLTPAPKVLEAGMTPLATLNLPGFRTSPYAITQRLRAGDDASDKILNEVRRDIIRSGPPSRAMDIARLATAVPRTALTLFDVSAPMIQLQVMGPRHPGIFANATMKGVRSLWNTQNMAKMFAENIDDVNKLIDHGLLFPGAGHNDFTELLRSGADSPTLFRYLKKVFAIPGRGFNGMLDASGLLMGIAKTRGRNLTDAQLDEIAHEINHIRGVTSMNAMGLSRTQQLIEGIVLFAPRYFRGTTSLILDATRGNIRGKEALIHLAFWYAGLSAANVAYGKAMGESWDEAWEHINPASAKFFTHEYGGVKFGPGGKVRSFLSLFGKMYNKAQEDQDTPADWVKEVLAEPGLSFLRGNLSPVVGTAVDVATGRDFLGEPTRDTPINFGRHTVLQNIMPIWAENALLEGGTIEQRVTRGGLEFVGMRAYPTSDSEIRNTYYEDQTGKTWGQRDPLEVEQLRASDPEFNDLYLRARDTDKWRSETEIQIDQVFTRRDTALTAIGNAWQAGEITGPQMYQAISEANRRLGIEFDLLRETDPEAAALMERWEDDNTESPLLNWYRRYNNITHSDQWEDPVTGEIDFNARDAALANLQRQMGTDTWNKVMQLREARRSELPQIVQQYYIDKEILKDYWNADPVRRRQLRMRNPIIDAILVFWRGYTPVRPNPQWRAQIAQAYEDFHAQRRNGQLNPVNVP